MTAKPEHRRVGNVAWGRMVSRLSLSGRLEFVLVFATLLALGIAVFGSHIVNGGFYWDDWLNAKFEWKLGYFGAVDWKIDSLGSKPFLAVLLPLPHLLFGTEPAPHLALAVVLSALTSACFYVLLRTLGVEWVHALTIAALALVFPWSDSIRLWATASINNVAICLYLVGLVVALRGLRHTGRRSWLMHVGAVSLYVLSVLTYEVVAVAALASILLYAYQSSWRRALHRWPLDLAGIGAALLYTAETTTKTVVPISDQVRHIGVMAEDGISLLGQALVPIDGVGGSIVAALMLLVVVGAAIVARRGEANDPLGTRLWRWVAIAVASLIGIAAAYAMFVPSAGFTPLSRGTENRVNVLAALPIATLVYSVTMLIALLAFRESAERERRSAVAALALCVLIGAGYISKDAADQRAWALAASLQEKGLRAMRNAVPQPPERATIYTFGLPGATARQVHVFDETWDLLSASALLWHDPSLRAYPVFEGARFACRPRRLVPIRLPTPYHDLDLRLNSPHPASPYGKTVFIDTRTAAGEVIHTKTQCSSALRRYRPGPF